MLSASALAAAMSCLALTLTCKTRPLWMQAALQNDVKPAQYEAELARLNRLLARSEEREKADKEYIDELYWQNVHATASWGKRYVIWEELREEHQEYVQTHKYPNSFVDSLKDKLSRCSNETSLEKHPDLCSPNPAATSSEETPAELPRQIAEYDPTTSSEEENNSYSSYWEVEE